jgi:hypothetical protein
MWLERAVAQGVADAELILPRCLQCWRRRRD